MGSQHELVWEMECSLLTNKLFETSTIEMTAKVRCRENKGSVTDLVHKIFRKRNERTNMEFFLKLESIYFLSLKLFFYLCGFLLKGVAIINVYRAKCFADLQTCSPNSSSIPVYTHCLVGFWNQHMSKKSLYVATA